MIWMVRSPMDEGLSPVGVRLHLRGRGHSGLFPRNAPHAVDQAHRRLPVTELEDSRVPRRGAGRKDDLVLGRRSKPIRPLLEPGEARPRRATPRRPGVLRLAWIAIPRSRSRTPPPRLRPRTRPVPPPAPPCACRHLHAPSPIREDGISTGSCPVPPQRAPCRLSHHELPAPAGRRNRIAHRPLPALKAACLP